MSNSSIATIPVLDNEGDVNPTSAKMFPILAEDAKFIKRHNLHLEIVKGNDDPFDKTDDVIRLTAADGHHFSQKLFWDTRSIIHRLVERFK